MKKNTKIVLGISILAGVSYLIYKNKDRIVGKFNKLSKMNNADDVIDDLGKTAGKAVDKVVDSAEDFYKYILSFIEDVQVDETANKMFWNDIDNVVKDMPEDYRSSLIKTQAFDLVNDIRNWSNPNAIYDETLPKKGMMPYKTYITWTNLLRNSKEDNDRILKIANILFQYGHPNVTKDTVKNNNAHKLTDYLDRYPSRFLEKNEVDWGTYKPINGIKPKTVFYLVKAKLNEGKQVDIFAPSTPIPTFIPTGTQTINR